MFSVTDDIAPVNGKSRKLSPMTTHRNTENGPVKGGFDRSAFFTRCERLFDKLFKYERQVSETYAYQNAQKHGTPEQKKEQAVLLADEKKHAIKEAVVGGLGQRREKVKAQNDLEEIASILGRENYSFPKEPDDSLSQALNIAELSVQITHIYEISNDTNALNLNLLALGVTCTPVFAKNGGVYDITIIKSGHRIKAQSIMDQAQLNKVLNSWEKLSGQKTAHRIDAEIRAAKAKAMAEEMEEELSQHTISLHL